MKKTATVTWESLVKAAAAERAAARAREENVNAESPAAFTLNSDNPALFALELAVLLGHFIQLPASESSKKSIEIETAFANGDGVALSITRIPRKET